MPQYFCDFFESLKVWYASLKSANDSTSAPEFPKICIASLTKGILGCSVTNLLLRCPKICYYPRYTC